MQGNPLVFLQDFLILAQLSSTAAQQHSSTAVQQYSGTAAQAAQAAQQHLKLRGFPLLKHSSNLRTQVRQKAETFTKFEGVLKMSLKISFKIPLVLHGKP